MDDQTSHRDDQNNQDYQDNQVIIYSAAWCAYCKTEKEYLDKLGVKYTVRDIDEDGDKSSSIPVTDIDGVIIRGFNRTKIDAVLKEKGLIS